MQLKFVNVFVKLIFGFGFGVLGVLAVIVSGCNSGQVLVEDSKRVGENFKTNVQSEISSKMPAGTMKQLEDLKKKSLEAKNAVLQAETMLTTVLEGHGINLPQKAQIEQILRTGSVDAKMAMQPVLEELSRRSPDMRSWVDQQITAQIKASNGPAKLAWQDLEKRVAAFKNPDKVQQTLK